MSLLHPRPCLCCSACSREQAEGFDNEDEEDEVHVDPSTFSVPSSYANLPKMLAGGPWPSGSGAGAGTTSGSPLFSLPLALGPWASPSLGGLPPLHDPAAAATTAAAAAHFWGMPGLSQGFPSHPSGSTGAAAPVNGGQQARAAAGAAAGGSVSLRQQPQQPQQAPPLAAGPSQLQGQQQQQQLQQQLPARPAHAAALPAPAAAAAEVWRPSQKGPERGSKVGACLCACPARLSGGLHLLPGMCMRLLDC